MKKLLLLLALVASTITLITGCRTMGIEDYPDTKQVSNLITNGNWRVNTFVQSNQVQTNNYNGYLFTFEPTGDVKATSASGITIGQWQSSDVTNRLIITFNNPNAELSKIAKEWIVNEQQPSTLSLINNDAGENYLLKIAQQ